MKRISVTILLILVAFGSSLIAQPKLEFDCGDTYDWGKVKPKDSPLKTKVKIFNKGNETLKITEVKPGCGCTTAPIDKDEIKPGDFATLDISLSIKNNPGRMTKSITISTNAPNQEKSILMLKCDIKTGYELMPSRFNFFNAKLNEENISKVVFTNTSEKDLTVKKIEIKPETFIVSGIKEAQVIKPGESIPIEGKITPKDNERFYPDLAITFTGDPDIDIVRITGSGQVPPPQTPESIKQDSIKRAELKAKALERKDLKLKDGEKPSLKMDSARKTNIQKKIKEKK